MLMSGDSSSRVEEALRAKRCSTNAKGMWQCPAHDDGNPSLSVKGAADRVLIYCHAGCSTPAVLAALGLRFCDLFDVPRAVASVPNDRTQSRRDPNASPVVVAEYVYTDRNGESISTKTRYEPGRDGARKSFAWGDGNPGVLYQLPLVIEAEHVHVNEGEKSADALNKVLGDGVVATCPPTTKWEESFTECLTGKRVVLWADRDATGLKRAVTVYAALTAAGIAVTVVQSKTENDKDDAFDHVAAGYSPDEAVELDLAKLDDANDRLEDCDERFQFVNVHEINYRLESRGLIKGAIDRSAFAVVYGAANSSKTFAVIDMGLRIAAGLPWFGRKTTQTAVLYIASEGGRSVSNRIAAHRERYLQGATNVPFYVLPSAINLLDPDGDIAPLIAAIRILEREAGVSFGLVIIDTLSQSMPGGDENGPVDMTKAVDSSNRIRREVDCTVLLVHHTGKNETKGSRGHSSLRAAADTELEVSEAGGGFFQISQTKQRDYARGAPVAYRLEVVEIGRDEDDEPVTTCVVVPADEGAIPEAKPKVKLDDRCRIFEGCIEGLLDANPQVLPPEVAETHVGHLAPGQRVVLAGDVRDLFYERLEDRDDERNIQRDSYRQVFRRTKEKLQGAKRIEVSDKWMWFGEAE